MSKRRLERIAILVSIVSFFGSTGFGAARMVTSAEHQPPVNHTATAASQPTQEQLQNSELLQQERGYRVVLKQEPNNQVALEGLVAVRLQMNNSKGAVGPLEELVKLNPEKQEYITLLAQVKKKVSETK